VLAYLGRYTHRVAIANHRLVSFEDGQVRFRWRDYADGNQSKILALSTEGRFTMVPTFSVYEDQTDLTRARTLPWLEAYTWPSIMANWTPNPEVHGSFYFEWTSADEAAWSHRLFTAALKSHRESVTVAVA